MNYTVIRHSMINTSIKFFKYNPDTNEVIFREDKGNSIKQYQILLDGLVAHNPPQAKNAIRSKLIKQGVPTIDEGELDKAVSAAYNFKHRITKQVVDSQGNPVVRHSEIYESEVIDVRDDEVLEHKNTNNVEHEEYVFVRSESGHTFAGYYARFETKGTIYVPWGPNTTFTMINAHFDDYDMRKIATIQQLKDEIGKQVKSKLPTGATVSSQELAKAAAFLWATYTDYKRKTRKKDLSHSYAIIFSKDELYHHGILGQKWGIRRFQNADGSLTSAGRERYGAGSGQKSGSEKGMVEMLVIPSIWAIELSAILGPAAVSAVKESKREKKAEKELFGDDINCGLTMEDIKKTNPNFGKDGYNMNCPKCSTVVELRKRGMDVQAKSGSGQSMKEMCSWFKGAKFEEDVNKDYVKDKLTELPKGASGFLAGNYKSMGGHVVHWTNIGDGKLRIEDGQCGKVFTWEQMEKKYNWGEDTYCYSRLDNCEIDKDLMYKMGVFEEVKGDEKKK